MGDLTNIAVNRMPLAMDNQIKKVATAQTLDVCQHAEHSVTLCSYGKPALRKFCSDACRQAAYRKSTAHMANLKRLRDARRARKNDYIAMKNARYKRPQRTQGIHAADGDKRRPCRIRRA